MRISENMKSGFLLLNLNRAMGRIMDTEEDLADSKRIHRPSDDPTGTARILSLKGYLDRYARYEQNVEDSMLWMSATESVLTRMLDSLSEADSIMVQAASDTLGPDERRILGDQMKLLYNQMLGLSNHEYGGNYIFGGTNTRDPVYTTTDTVTGEAFFSAFDEPVYLEHTGLRDGFAEVTSVDGSTVYAEGTDYTLDKETGAITVLSTGTMADAAEYRISYRTEEALTAVLNPDGVDGAMIRPVDEGVEMQINLRGDALFGGSGGVLDVLKQAINALERNDTGALKTIRTGVSNQIDQVTRYHGEVGAKINRLDTLKEKLAADQVNFQKLISTIEDADIPAAILQLQNDQAVYQAALKTGASIIQSSLLDYL